MNQRKKQIEELFENFQTIKRSIMSCPRGMHQAHRITPSQWMVIRMIEKHNEATVKILAGILEISSSATTQLIDGLVKEGYVSRKESPTDRRSMLLTLSPQTKEKLMKMKQEAIKQLIQTFKILTDEELKNYLELNKKIISNINCK